MEWQIQPDPSSGIIRVKVTGRITATPLRQMTTELRDAISQYQLKQLLLDYTETISGLEPYEVFERPKVLQELEFPVDAKVAVLYRALDENTQFLENVYRNQSFPVRVFADHSVALNWLTMP